MQEPTVELIKTFLYQNNKILGKVYFLEINGSELSFKVDTDNSFIEIQEFNPLEGELKLVKERITKEIINEFCFTPTSYKFQDLGDDQFHIFMTL
jgi:hypothetical protein